MVVNGHRYFGSVNGVHSVSLSSLFGNSRVLSVLKSQSLGHGSIMRKDRIRVGFERFGKAGSRKEWPQVGGESELQEGDRPMRPGVARLPGTWSPSKPVTYLVHFSAKSPFYILPMMLELGFCKFHFPDSFVFALSALHHLHNKFHVNPSYLKNLV